MDYDFDLIVVGSGAGGGTLAARCAGYGRKVLLVERGLNDSGQQSATNGADHNEEATLIKKLPYDDQLLQIDGVQKRIYAGGIPGGGTSVYGAALLRPSRSDFQPGKYYPKRLSRELWDWPVGYEILEPYYDEAERLFEVAADPQDTLSPLESSGKHTQRDLLPLAPINRKLIERSREKGLNPFRLPLGIRTSTCLRCDHCAGFTCPNGSRRSSRHLVSESIANGDSLKFLTNTQVSRLIRGANGKLTGVELIDRSTGETSTYTARRYAVAAGAVNTPVILKRSGFDHDLIGRNYMMHHSPLVAGIFMVSTGAADSFVKQLGFADYYFGTDDLPEKMGIIQSLPAPGPYMLAKNGLGYLPHWMLNQLRKRLLPLVGTIEDLPNVDNRVVVNQDSVSLHHRYSDFDQARADSLCRKMQTILKSAGAIHCVTKRFPSKEHVAHQCGTVRFGTDSKHAVVDSDCRMFGQEDLFVVDGSIFPTSLGVGPSLTIIANALRVADILHAEL